MAVGSDLPVWQNNSATKTGWVTFIIVSNDNNSAFWGDIENFAGGLGYCLNIKQQDNDGQQVTKNFHKSPISLGSRHA